MQVVWLLPKAFLFSPGSEGAVFPRAEVWGLAFGTKSVGAEFILGFLGGNTYGYLRPTSWLRAMRKVMRGPHPSRLLDSAQSWCN